MLLDGEEENLGALHRAIQWCVGNFLLSIVTHISTCSNTVRTCLYSTLKHAYCEVPLCDLSNSVL